MKKKDVKLVIAFSQVALIALAFFLVNGFVAVALYLASEISLAELAEFLSMLGGSDSFAIIGYHIFKKSKDRLWRLLNEERDSEVVSEHKIKELMKLLKK